MVAPWTPILVLPNIELLNAIECKIAALVPALDQRVVDLKDAQPMFREFLGRFGDNFGEKFEPAVLFLRADALGSYCEIGALVGFRDLAAISAMAYGRAHSLLYPSGAPRVLFGESFAFYPWMIDKRYENLIGQTAAFLGIHEIKKLRGQSSPSVFRVSLDDANIDDTLLSALLERWQRRYSGSKENWADIALFRSLNMAYHASLLPGATETTFYDVGRLISLWVSAFEILVHPGDVGEANRDRVFDLIERTPWSRPEMRELKYDTGRKKKVKRTLASYLYDKLHNLRNDFLHGNPVKRDDHLLPVSGRSVLEYAAPLYRLALTSFLPLTYDNEIPPIADANAFGIFVANRMSYMEPQKYAEKAILTANQPPGARRGPTIRRDH